MIEWREGRIPSSIVSPIATVVREVAMRVRDVLQKAFREPFVTGEEILRKERAGLGLGLHLARQLVVLHGGIMWADPLPSGGTRVA